MSVFEYLLLVCQRVSVACLCQLTGIETRPFQELTEKDMAALDLIRSDWPELADQLHVNLALGLEIDSREITVDIEALFVRIC